MTEFRVGDRVRAIVADSLGWDVGYETIIVKGSDGELAIYDKEGIDRYFLHTEWELTNSPADELITLRQFRARALAKYPDLAEESDFEAAKRICKECDWSSGSDCVLPEGDEWEDSVAQAIYNGIAWARANPR
jgi:hypothetical protein